MVADVVPGARVRRVRRLGGGLSGAVFAVDLDDAKFAGEPLDRVVVKHFRPGDDFSAGEWECLEFAQRVALDTPRRLARDADGRWFGVPALVMTYLPGRVHVLPRDVDDWLRQLALAMATIHATATDGAPPVVLRESDPQTWTPPTLVGGPRVERSLRVLETALPRGGWPPVLIHGDFHPCQALWQRGRLTSVVDWGDLNVGPRWYEVAYCRADVALLYGVKGADGLLEHYVAITGLQPVDLPAFDLMCGMNARQWGHRFLDAYQAVGRTDTVRQFAARLAPFNRRALAELGG
jgi:aminoglycoside phosphotransferase (APT) family kinase protein